MNLILEQFFGFQQIHVGADAETHDRHGGGVVAAQRRAVDAVGQRFHHPVEPVADIRNRLFQIGAPGEFDGNRADSLGGNAGNFFDPGHRADTALDRSGDQLLDFFRTGVFVFGTDRNRREIDFRKQVDRQVAQRKAAQYQHDACDH
ncbi:hypothetical protein SDC9_81173 [bioreactor metagenome]|uniref:Uncharacterized protein n=1 Tax=bioreactor metagenome TaxID=1076179 RepID=A0A644Z1T5_9ZZZZ